MKSETSSAMLSALLEAAVDAIIMMDATGVIQIANPSAATLFGYERDELIGKRVEILMPSPYREQHEGFVNHHIDTGEKRIIGIGREVTGKRKDDTVFPLRLSVGEAVVDGQHCFVGILHDLTSRKKAEEEIKLLNTALEQRVSERTEKLGEVINQLLNSNEKLKHEIEERTKAENALLETEKELRESLEKEKELGNLKSRFVSIASHEFRTPLSTIQSSASLISKYTTLEQQPDRERHITRIRSSVVNLTNILNEFLSLSKLEEGRVDYMPQETSMPSLCHDLIDEVQGLLKKGQIIECNCPEHNPVIIVEARLLKNIMINLVSNASKYSGEDQVIRLNLKYGTGHMTLEVKDHGIGIPLSEQQHLFERFFRASNAMNIQGTGLGLSIVAKYLELLNGTIHFVSDVGQGTTFTIEIPIQHA